MSSRDAFYLGVMHKMSDKTTLKLALGQADELDVAEETGATYLALGVSQKLSKDTELYALFASVSNDDGATYRLDGVGLPTTGTPSAPVPGRDLLPLASASSRTSAASSCNPVFP
ncbi:MAG: hypothetical protein IPM20_07375 [Gammaproteobacteria bacterium]|nr:hypothetical protein [Gammaproteobacteria bacterium]